MISISHISKKY